MTDESRQEPEYRRHSLYGIVRHLVGDYLRAHEKAYPDDVDYREGSKDTLQDFLHFVWGTEQDAVQKDA